MAGQGHRDDLWRGRGLAGPLEYGERGTQICCGRDVMARMQFGLMDLIMSVQWHGMPQGLALDELRLLAQEVFPKAWQG